MISPQLAKQTEVTSLGSFINDTSWVMEQKLDGHRLLLCSPGGDFPPTALTRSGSPYTRTLPKAIQDFRFPTKTNGEHYGVGEWVLDGELVDKTFWAFDLPVTPFETGNAGGVMLSHRRLMLETFFQAVTSPFKLVPQARTTEEKVALAQKAYMNNFEGLVLKKTNAPYRSGGRTPEWLKVKFVTTADVVVMDVRDDGKDSVRLGLYHNGVLSDVGRSSLIGKEKQGAISKGDVIEVRYLYTGAGGRLYQPTILGKRDDKPASQCTTGQLKFVNKQVLEAL